jgi:hypothetical protein
MTNQITVTATIPVEETSEKSSIEIWSYINRHIEQDGEARNINQIDFKYRLRDHFGHNLKQQINTYFHDSWYGSKFPTLSSLETVALASFFFEVSDIHLTPEIKFKIHIVGIEKVVELFSNNLELFEAILRSYIPSTFMATIMMNNVSLDWKLKLNGVVIKAFEESDQSQRDKNKLIDKKTRVGVKQWLVNIMNTPLIGPLILAVLIAWAWNQIITHKMEEIKAQLEAVYDTKNLDLSWQKKWLIEEKERVDKDKDRLNSITKKIVEEKTQPIPSKTSAPSNSEN